MSSNLPSPHDGSTDAGSEEDSSRACGHVESSLSKVSGLGTAGGGRLIRNEDFSGVRAPVAPPSFGRF